MKNILRGIIDSFDWPCFGIVAAVYSLFQCVVYRHISNYDPGSNLKYAIFCWLILLCEAATISFIRRQGVLRDYLLTVLLPTAAALMELVNFKLVRVDFFAQTFHFYAVFYGWLFIVFTLRELPCLPQGVHRTMKIMQTVVEIALYVVMCGVVANYLVVGAGIDESAVVAICQTNLREAWDYYWYENSGAQLTVLLVILLLVIGWCCVWLHRKRVMAEPVLRQRHVVLAAVLLVCLFLGNLAIGVYSSLYPYYQPMTWQLLGAYRDYRAKTMEYELLAEKRQEQMAAFTEMLKKDDTLQHRDGLYVLFIGESLNKNYMGCYGHRQETTPFQSQLTAQDNVVKFSQMYACHVQTTLVVPQMLTVDNQYISSDISDVERSLSLLDLAKAHGFRVLWFSNQERVSRANSIISSIAMAADKAVFMSDMLKSDGMTLDMSLLEEMAKEDLSGNTLVIVHLYGNHCPYGKSYPKDFEAPKTFSVYEKSVLYNDTVMKMMVKFFQQRNAAVMAYLSDHSEDVRYGKGHDPRPSKFEFEMVEIPFWLYMSPEYVQDNAQMAAALQAARERVMTNDLMFYLFLELMNFHVQESWRPYSPLSDNYILKSKPALTLGGKLEISAH